MGLNVLSKARPRCLGEVKHRANSLLSSPSKTPPRLTMVPSPFARLALNIDRQAPRSADKITLDLHGRQGLSFLSRPNRAGKDPCTPTRLRLSAQGILGNVLEPPTLARSPLMNDLREVVVSDFASVARGPLSAHFVIHKKLIPI